MKLIDADVLFRKLYNTDPNTKGKFSDGIVKAMCFIINTPAIEAEPVRHGQWISREGYYSFCSECKMSSKEFGRMPFCPNCGAKMDIRKEQVE